MAEKHNNQERYSQKNSLDSDIVSAKKEEPTLKGFPWYQEEIGSHLAPAEILFYETYVGLKGDELKNHLKRVRDRAWPLGKYPCVGSWTFLHMPMIDSPAYPAALARIREGATVLDLGCGFGQNLRRLVHDGAPSENLRASDISGELWDLGYELFQDRDSMKALFFEGDLLSDEFDKLKILDGQVDIILAYSFLHLFGWEDQVKAVKKMVGMSRVGTVILGSQMGRAIPQEKVTHWGSMFYHTAQTFEELWQRVERETGTKWEAKSRLVDLGEWGLQREDYIWMDKNNRAIDFVIERVPNSTSAL